MRLIAALILAIACSVILASALPLRPKQARLMTALASPFRRHGAGFSLAAGDNKISSENVKNHWNIRGGVCCEESDWKLALKAGLSAATETVGLTGMLAGAQKLSAKMTTIPLLSKTIGGLPVLQWASFVLVIFSSSAIKNVVDGSISAASNQVFRPNVVPGDGNWYASLKKPWFNPPAWLFPIMWVIISKPTQMWAVSRLFKYVSPTPWPILAVYCAHLSLGDIWNQVFFGCQKIRLGAGVICTFWGMLAGSAYLFGCVDKTAGLLLLPTLGWVTVASALNLEIYRLNRDKW